MREVILTMPVDTETQREAERALEARLLADHGGLTAIDGIGSWRDPQGVIHTEPVKRLVVATDAPGARRAVATLHAIACKAGEAAIYYVDETGAHSVKACKAFHRAQRAALARVTLRVRGLASKHIAPLETVYFVLAIAHYLFR